MPVVESNRASSMKILAAATTPKSSGDKSRAINPAIRRRAAALSKVLDARRVAPLRVFDLSGRGFAVPFSGCSTWTLETGPRNAARMHVCYIAVQQGCKALAGRLILLRCKRAEGNPRHAG